MHATACHLTRYCMGRSRKEHATFERALLLEARARRERLADARGLAAVLGRLVQQRPHLALALDRGLLELAAIAHAGIADLLVARGHEALVLEDLVRRGACPVGLLVAPVIHGDVEVLGSAALLCPRALPSLCLRPHGLVVRLGILVELRAVVVAVKVAIDIVDLRGRSCLDHRLRLDNRLGLDEPARARHATSKLLPDRGKRRQPQGFGRLLAGLACRSSGGCSGWLAELAGLAGCGLACLALLWYILVVVGQVQLSGRGHIVAACFARLIRVQVHPQLAVPGKQSLRLQQRRVRHLPLRVEQLADAHDLRDDGVGGARCAFCLAHKVVRQAREVSPQQQLSGPQEVRKGTREIAACERRDDDSVELGRHVLEILCKLEELRRLLCQSLQQLLAREGGGILEHRHGGVSEGRRSKIGLEGPDSLLLFGRGILHRCRVGGQGLKVVLLVAGRLARAQIRRLLLLRLGIALILAVRAQIGIHVVCVVEGLLLAAPRLQQPLLLLLRPLLVIFALTLIIIILKSARIHLLLAVLILLILLRVAMEVHHADLIITVLLESAAVVLLRVKQHLLPR
eukprot:m.224752 g.224752  ORF g.224752 m.224752 type:complete len:572 (+) comp11145_c0_seq1:51-1766(+)